MLKLEIAEFLIALGTISIVFSCAFFNSSCSACFFSSLFPLDNRFAASAFDRFDSVFSSSEEELNNS
jgi:hypothetical protein